MTRKRKSLWIIPHQDDEVLSMGMAIIYNSYYGNENFILQVSDGSGSSVLDILNGLTVCTCTVCPIGQVYGTHDPISENYLDGSLDKSSFSLARDREQEEALTIMGAQLYKRLKYPDGSVDLYVNRITNEIITWINNNGGDIAIEQGLINIGVTSYKDASSDHQACANAVTNVKNIYKSKGLRLNTHYYLSPSIWNQYGELVFNKNCVETLKNALNTYKLYEPISGRYEIGWHSVQSLFEKVYNTPISKYHIN